MAEYKLKNPIKTVDGREVTSVEINENLSGADLEDVANVPDSKAGTAMLMLVSKSIGFSLTTVRNMSGKDVKAISKAAEGFLSDGGDLESSDLKKEE